MRVRALAIGLLLAAFVAPSPSRAQNPAETTREATGASLALILELGNSKLDGESVRKAIELELKRPVRVRAAAADGQGLTVTAHADRSVTVTYRANDGSSRTRSIGVPRDNARAAEVIALLAGNLSRDEAAELLANLAGKAAPEAESATNTEGAPEPREALARPDAAKSKPAEKRPAPPPRHAQPSARPPLLPTPFPAFNLSLFPPVTLYRRSERRIFAGELGLFYSHVGELHGAGLNVFVLRTARDVQISASQGCTGAISRSAMRSSAAWDEMVCVIPTMLHAFCLNQRRCQA